jgi:hypothetical protein
VAKDLIDIGIKEGNWVMLQNCHLYQSWFDVLDSKVKELKYTAKEKFVH